MSRVVFAIGLCFLIGLNYGAKLETRRYYHIQAFDGAFLTVGGDNSGGVKMMTEDSHGTDPRQTFWVGAGSESHEIMPQMQNTFSTLLVALEMKSNLIFQQTRSLGARYQWWIINDLGDSKWSLQNVRTGFCMTSNGKNTQPMGVICDRSSSNQTWNITASARKIMPKSFSLPR